MFQSTRPRGARPDVQLSAAAPSGFQSTRPRGARRRQHRTRGGGRRVSIHAPARGATFPRCHGAGAHGLFQSTRPRGARPKGESSLLRIVGVSIHAPARGATPNVAVIFGDKEKFQSTRPRGARPGTVMPSTFALTCFNPRAREGRDRDIFHHGSADRRFNPRAREGRDREQHSTRADRDVSIHAPARGATILKQDKSPCKIKFQSTRPRGARHLFSCSKPTIL